MNTNTKSIQYTHLFSKLLLFLLIGSLSHVFVYNFVLNQNYFSKSNQSNPLILLYTHNHSHKTREHICKGKRNTGHIVNFDRCPMKCEFSCRLKDFHERSPAALLFFGEDFYWPFKLSNKDRKSTQQRWIFWSWETPIQHPEYSRSKLTFNWTMTYRHDSDILHSYGSYMLRNSSRKRVDDQLVDFYSSSQTNQSTFDVKKEYHQRKNRILWFVSNCHAKTKRNQIAKQLGKLYPIDQFGKCSKSNRSVDFEQLLFQYKFYLAFENSYCEDYITEKVFYNSFAHGSIPLVLGPDKKNYERVLPPNSFIHVESYPKLTKLAQELRLITEDLNIYSSYHQWRIDYRLIVRRSSYYIDHIFCDLCIKLHTDHAVKTYSNFSGWLNKCKK